jgi:hypothetical protein
MATVTIAVEGTSDLAVVRKILTYVGCTVGIVQGRGGKSQLDRNLAGYNRAAQSAPWFVLRDLDHDAPCASALRDELLPVAAASEWMRFRIAVREVESWILADAGAVAKFLRIKRNLIPDDPDDLDDPKLTLIDLARRSPNESIKADMVQAVGSMASEGPAYVSRVNELVTNFWNPHVARGRSDSLYRCIESLNSLAAFEE